MKIVKMKLLPEVQLENASRKRKRESEKRPTAVTAVPQTTACFTNAAFSSTPKKLIARRRKQTSIACKEHSKAKFPPSCLEIKSIANIVEEAQRAAKKQLEGLTEPLQELPKNPYEVLRKPPKKKKRHTDIEEACFENPALNLELPEKQFNPYEVVRVPVTSATTPLSHAKWFVNEALNLRGQDAPMPHNPFEIQRCQMQETEVTSESAGVENLALEVASVPTRLKIGLPFTPTVGCRINFKNMPLSELTPSKLLAEKLVFSPVPRPKHSLDSIGEENSTMDIGKELDRYQLELENSINEAKLRRSFNHCDVVTEQELTYKYEVVEQKITFTQKLAEIVEDEEEEALEDGQEQSIVEIKKIDNSTQLVLNINDAGTAADNQELPATEIKKEMSCQTLHKEQECVAGLEYGSVSEEEQDLDFKAPAPFVRTYRRDATDKLTASKESLDSVHSSKSSDSVDQKKPINVKSLIRKSIRKLMHPMHAGKDSEDAKAEREPEKHMNIISSIRHSLRRKPGRQLLVEDTCLESQPEVVAEISIIDSTERTMKLKSNMLQTEYVRIEQLTNEKKHSLRHSIRQSTREMRQQLMKSVFHKKQEEYAFCK